MAFMLPVHFGEGWSLSSLPPMKSQVLNCISCRGGFNLPWILPAPSKARLGEGRRRCGCHFCAHHWSLPGCSLDRLPHWGVCSWECPGTLYPGQGHPLTEDSQLCRGWRYEVLCS